MGQNKPDADLDYYFNNFLMTVHYFTKAVYIKDLDEAKAILELSLFRDIENIKNELDKLISVVELSPIPQDPAS